MASEKQIVARKINWELARMKCMLNVAYSISNLTNNSDIYKKWERLVNKTEKLLKSSYLK